MKDIIKDIFRNDEETGLLMSALYAIIMVGVIYGVIQLNFVIGMAVAVILSLIFIVGVK